MQVNDINFAFNINHVIKYKNGEALYFLRRLNILNEYSGKLNNNNNV